MHTVSVSSGIFLFMGLFKLYQCPRLALTGAPITWSWVTEAEPTQLCTLRQENPSTTKRNKFSTTNRGIILGGNLIKQADSDQARYCTAVGQSGVKCSRQRSVNCWQAPIIIYQSVSSLVLLIEFQKMLVANSESSWWDSFVMKSLFPHHKTTHQWFDNLFLYRLNVWGPIAWITNI